MRINKFIYLIIICFAVSCSEELIENEKQDSKPKITLGLAPENSTSGRTNAVIVQPTNGTFYSGNTMNITWSFLTCLCGDWTSSNINIELYKGSNYITRIASNVPFVDANYNSQYNWIIPAMTSTGSDFKIRITNSSNSSEYADSDNISLVTPDASCYYSHWVLEGMPSSSVSNNITVPYEIREDGLATLTYANSPTIRITAYSPINVVYNGVTYYCPGDAGVNIPINSSVGCDGSTTISAPLTFQKIGYYNTVMVYLYSNSFGHYGSNGYHSFYIY